jgi:uncharacterized membrane protein
MNFEIKVHINQPVKDVFRYVSNFSNHKEMIKANVDSKQTSEGPVKVGTTMRNVAKFMGVKMEEHFVVTEFIPDKLIAKESAPGSTFVTGDKMTVEEENGGTLLTLHVYAHLKGFLKLFDGYLEKKVRRSLTEDMERLKEKKVF